jgi:hypothetical protein
MGCLTQKQPENEADVKFPKKSATEGKPPRFTENPRVIPAIALLGMGRASVSWKGFERMARQSAAPMPWSRNWPKARTSPH